MLKFFRPEYGETIEDARSVPKCNNMVESWFVLEAAEYIYHEEDGWESHWPQTIAIVTEIGEIKLYSIGLEYNPDFYVDEVL